ncbi:MAG: nitrilase-related carbon-nitrogen hydrolase [Oscillospiraceae bacterium]
MLKMNLKTGSLAMSYLINEEKVRAITENCIFSPRRELSFVPDGIKPACCNFKLREYENTEDFISDIARYVKIAAEEGAQLLVFPQLIGECALTFMPGFKKIKKELAAANAGGRDSSAEAFRSVVQTTQGFVGEIFLNAFSMLAKSYKMILAGGGSYTLSGDKIYNTIYCFDENGNVAGMQNKIFLSAKEKKWGVSKGTSLTPAETSLGEVALLFSESCRNYEPYYIARSLGCKLAIISASPFAPETGCLTFRANETGLAIAVSGLSCKNEGLGINVQESARIAVPLALTPDESGILKPGEGSVISARIDLTKLSHCFDVYTADMNLNFIKWLTEINE